MDMISRRDFVRSTSFALAASACAGRLPRNAVGGATAPSPARTSPLGFSTLGCPNWTWHQVLDFAAAHGYAAIELRGLLTEMDLTKVPELSAGQLERSRGELAERALRVSCLGASANMHEMDPAKHEAALDEGRRFIDLAQELHAPYVRVFGNRLLPGVSRDVMLAHIAAGLRALGEHAAGRGVMVLLESHGDFTDSPTLREIMERTNSPSVAILWDAHHTFASGHEEPEVTVAQLGRWIRHTHLKDSIPQGSDRRYVLLGKGDVPVRRQIEALVRIGYSGIYSFEWEKRWHPEIEAPEIAIAQFAEVASGYLRDAARARSED